MTLVAGSQMSVIYICIIVFVVSVTGVMPCGCQKTTTNIAHSTLYFTLGRFRSAGIIVRYQKKILKDLVSYVFLSVLESTALFKLKITVCLF